MWYADCVGAVLGLSRFFVMIGGKRMKLWVLAENTACREGLISEHGLSLYIETGEHKILFDMGQTDAFARNAECMGIDLAQADLAVLSHGHYDHGGGLAAFLEINSHAPVYMSPHAFQPHFNGQDQYIGLNTALSGSSRIRFAGQEETIGDGLTLYSGEALPCPHPFGNFGLTMEEAGKRKGDDFRHEQYLLLREGDKRILISGCSHKGILNIAERFRPDVLIGGFHFMKMDPESEALSAAANRLMTYDTRYFTGHCTGDQQFDALKKIMGDRLEAISTGMYFEV